MCIASSPKIPPKDKPPEETAETPKLAQRDPLAGRRTGKSTLRIPLSAVNGATGINVAN